MRAVSARKLAQFGVSCLFAVLPLCAQTSYLSIMLPERTRLLQDQRIDILLEARNITSTSNLKVTANGRDITSQFEGPVSVDLDCDGRNDTVYRARLVSFQDLGNVRVVASVTGGSQSYESIKDIKVYPFSLPTQKRNVILYIGDAMGTAYRDAGRLVGRSVETVPGVSGMREGFFDSLLEMDKLPVTGMVMTYASDRVIPDSANTASAWSSGNKTFEGALNVFLDGTDCVWRPAANTATLPAVLDNPRMETLWEYLKRKYNYRTGVVTTAYVTDATPAGEGAHTATRTARFEVARQYLENPMLNGQPVYDVVMGGGKDEFDPDIRADGRNLVAEFQTKGFKFVSTATELRNVTSADGKVLGLFRRSNSGTRHSSGIRSSVDANMDVAYDKLGLVRPASEPKPSFGTWTDQPFLDLMTQKAIDVLSAGGTQPFILMVEGASIDKQSHPNHAAGTIWDVLELDKAIGVGRRFAQARRPNDTLVVVTADHDQSMSIIGLNDTNDDAYSDVNTSTTLDLTTGPSRQTAKMYSDANSNVRASYPYFGSGGDPNTTGLEGVPTPNNQNVYAVEGFPNYIDSNGDGYPENRAANGKGTRRLSVGFRTGNHTGSSVPVSAEGPGAYLFIGYQDQSDLMFKMAGALTGDTADGDAFVNNVLTNPKTNITIGKQQ